MSLFSLLLHWFVPPAAREWPAAPRQDAGSPRLAERENPPPRGEFPAVDVAQVIAPHADLLQRLRDAYGCDRPTFERDIGGVVARYAAFVHLLPATPDGSHRHAGGLFRMGLEIGFYALQAADGAIFSPRQTITARSAMEPRWRYAAFLAGLCSELHRALSHLTVRNDRGAEWPAYLGPLALWLRETNSTGYDLRWVRDPPLAAALGTLAITHIVTPSIVQQLAHGNPVLGAQFVAALGSSFDRREGSLGRLVRRSSALVLEQAAGPVDAPWPSAPPAEALPRLALLAPARLHPAVRDALRQIIDNSHGLDGATFTADGVFVPLRAFEARGVDPALAVRALGEAHMLAIDAGKPQSRTCSCQVDDEQVLGVLLAPRYCSGSDAPACGAPDC